MTINSDEYNKIVKIYNAYRLALLDRKQGGRRDKKITLAYIVENFIIPLFVATIFVVGIDFIYINQTILLNMFDNDETADEKEKREIFTVINGTICNPIRYKTSYYGKSDINHTHSLACVKQYNYFNQPLDQQYIPSVKKALPTLDVSMVFKIFDIKTIIVIGALGIVINLASHDKLTKLFRLKFGGKDYKTLEKMIKQKSAEIVTLRKENKALYSELGFADDKMESEAASAAEKMENLQNQLNESIQKIDSLQITDQNYQKTIESIQTELNDTIELSQETITTLEETLLINKNAVVSLQKNLLELNESNKYDIDNLGFQMEFQIGTLNNTIKSQQNDIDEQSNLIKQLNVDLIEFTDDKNKLQNKLNETTSEVDNLTTQLYLTDEEVIELQTQLHKKNDEVEKLNAELLYKGEFDEDELKELKTKLKTSESDVINIRHTLENQNKNFKISQDENVKLQKRNRKLTHRNQETNKDFETSKKNIITLNDDANKRIIQLLHTKQVLKNLHFAYSLKAAEIKDQTDFITNLEELLVVAGEKLVVAEKQLAVAEEKIIDSTNYKDKVVSDLSQMVIDIAKLSSQISNMPYTTSQRISELISKLLNGIVDLNITHTYDETIEYGSLEQPQNHQQMIKVKKNVLNIVSNPQPTKFGLPVARKAANQYYNTTDQGKIQYNSEILKPKNGGKKTRSTTKRKNTFSYSRKCIKNTKIKSKKTNTKTKTKTKHQKKINRSRSKK